MTTMALTGSISFGATNQNPYNHHMVFNTNSHYLYIVVGSGTAHEIDYNVATPATIRFHNFTNPIQRPDCIALNMATNDLFVAGMDWDDGFMRAWRINITNFNTIDAQSGVLFVPDNSARVQWSIQVDGTNNYVYTVASLFNSSFDVKFNRLNSSTLTTSGSLTYPNVGDTTLSGVTDMILDEANDKLYIAWATAAYRPPSTYFPGRVERLTGSTLSGSTTGNYTGDENLNTINQDTNGFLYAFSNPQVDAPGPPSYDHNLLKINSNLTLNTSAFIGNNGGGDIVNTAYDAINNKLFFTLDSVLYKYNLDTFTLEDSLVMANGSTRSIAVDPYLGVLAVNGYQYLDRYTTGDPPPVAPVFTRPATPRIGSIGNTVTFVGTGFTTVTSITFNGTPATFTIVNDGLVVVVIPVGATTGPVVFTTPGGTDSFNYTVTSPAGAQITQIM